jgi:hypothetical protein
MAKVVERPPETKLYQTDGYAWAARQAELLRARRFDELDLDHLIEEVQDLGINRRKEAFSRTQQIIRHLLKLQYSRAHDPRQGWRQTVADQRDELELLLTASLRRDLEASLDARWQRARRRAIQDLLEHGEATDDLPAVCPYALDQIIDLDWLPANRHGLEDPRPRPADD